jgi:hypothetical protein
VARTPSGQEVVVKIFMTCFAIEPDWNGREQAVMEWVAEEELAHREWWAYNRLRHLQGNAIPQSYGFYDVFDLLGFGSVKAEVLIGTSPFWRPSTDTRDGIYPGHYVD